MRELWTKEVVTFEGKWNRVIRAGLNPLPVQRPIPVWFGGGSEQVLKRIGTTGDGWITTTRIVGLGDAYRGMIDRIHGYAREAGRDPAEIGIEGTVDARLGSPEDWVDAVAKWRDYGATHVTFNTMNSGFETPEEHIDAISQVQGSDGVRGRTPIPSTSSGQALAFPHRKGRERMREGMGLVGVLRGRDSSSRSLLRMTFGWRGKGKDRFRLSPE